MVNLTGCVIVTMSNLNMMFTVSGQQVSVDIHTSNADIHVSVMQHTSLDIHVTDPAGESSMKINVITPGSDSTSFCITVIHTNGHDEYTHYIYPTIRNV
jgi:hypothetical protein